MAAEVNTTRVSLAGLRAEGWLVLLGVCCLLVFSAPAQTPVTQATISYEMPSEIVDGGGQDLPVAVAVFPLDFFDDFSWRSFVALNWPAKAGARGLPDTTKSIDDPGRRVWETWKAGYEIVPKQVGSTPTPWSSLDGETPCLDVKPAGSANHRILGVWAPFGDFNQAGFGFGSHTGPLVDQQGTYTRYEVRVNEQEYGFIYSHKLYLKSTIAGLEEPLRFPDGSIEVKAAWRELGGGVSDEEASTYYTILADVYDAAEQTCEKKRMGLTGFHIVHKTPLRPQWIWSSFEHVNNVPPHGTAPPATAKLAYNDPAKAQATDPSPPKIEPSNKPKVPAKPTQVVREKPLHPASDGAMGTAAINLRYQQKLANTVWKNYMLVATQWPSKTMDPTVSPPDNILGNPVPDGSDTSVANTTMETYFQTFGSCMGCHDVARKQNLDFVFFLDYHALNDTGQDGAQPRTLKLLEEKIRKAREEASEDQQPKGDR